MTEPSAEEFKQYQQQINGAIHLYRRFGMDGLYSVPEDLRELYQDMILMHDSFRYMFEQEIMKAVENAYNSGIYDKEAIKDSVINDQLVTVDRRGVTRTGGDPNEETKLAVENFLEGTDLYIEDLRQVFVDSVEHVFKIKELYQSEQTQ